MQHFSAHCIMGITDAHRLPSAWSHSSRSSLCERLPRFTVRLFKETTVVGRNVNAPAFQLLQNQLKVIDQLTLCFPQHDHDQDIKPHHVPRTFPGICPANTSDIINRKNAIAFRIPRRTWVGTEGNIKGNKSFPSSTSSICHSPVKRPTHKTLAPAKLRLDRL